MDRRSRAHGPAMHVYAVVDTDLDFCLLAEYSVTINNTTIVPEGGIQDKVFYFSFFPSAFFSLQVLSNLWLAQ